ncbi:Mannitol dehydrogenase [Camellia lanceoleosa]|uniref:Mannitol dehydrogenase n=1 Tax=Camellia lanceoleosa TaxID=1840588 RepID=A0ACC0GY82_9ERIC|nr:Mannitol dehydrogenase [Camellia lanceoleosa]
MESLSCLVHQTSHFGATSLSSAYGEEVGGGSLLGGLKEVQEMIDFAAKHNITADIEVIPMDHVNTAMERLTKSDVKYRFVIDVANTLKAI